MFIKKIVNYIKNLNPIIVQTPWVGAIGNMSQEIYLGLLRARREKRKILFLYPYDLFKPFYFSKFGLGTNSSLKNIKSEYILFSQNNPIVVILNLLLTGLYLPLISMEVIFRKIFNLKLPKWFRAPYLGREKLWKRNENFFLLLDEVKKWKWEDEFSHFLPIYLSNSSIKKAEQIRKKIGLPKDAWFTCVHVRDGGYYEKNSDYREGIAKRLRNSNIEKYSRALKLITESGGWVVRLGNSSMKPLNKMEKVIDYPFTEFKSDLMDIYFLKECLFFLGPQSGIADVAIMFQKPSIFIDHFSEIIIPPPHHGDLCIYKHVYSLVENRRLKLSELMNEFEKNKGINFYTTKQFKLIENSEQEIFDVVKEFLDQKERFYKYSENQKKWNDKAKSVGKRTIENMDLGQLYHTPFSDDAELTKYRIAANLFGSSGSIGDKYLRDNY